MINGIHNTRWAGKTLLLTILALTLCALVACGSQSNQSQSSSSQPSQPQSSQPQSESPAASNGAADREIIEAIVDNFMLLAEVPRPSHHEEKIGAFLMSWAEEQGLSPTQDPVGNVMFDVPATEGMDDRPLTILQAHMDMVAVAEDGKQFDPLNDAITVIRKDDENTLTADGTSLGADDGIGLAIAMAATEGKMAHGPLRIIVTVDEEDGMIGAAGIDTSWFDGAVNLINIDNEASNQVLVSTASSVSVHLAKLLEFTDPSGDTALDIELSGLKGGHSGVDIDEGRLNGIIGLAEFLMHLTEAGIPHELASFDGGTAANAIPPKARAVIVVDSADKAKVEQEAAIWVAELQKEYEGIEDSISCTVTEESALPKVLSAQDMQAMVRLATHVIDGVHSMSADMKDLVESSSNLGIFTVDENGLLADMLVRSSLGEKETEIVETQTALAKEAGYEVEVTKHADPWPYDPNSKLVELAKEVYKEQNGEDIDVAAVHAGVECGTFKVLKPELDMISIGPDLKDVHTPGETLYLDSIPKTWRLLEGILARV